MHLKRKISVLLLAATPALLAACGDDGGTDVEGPGEVSLVLIDPPAPASARLDPGAALSALEGGRYSGTFQGLVSVEVSVDGESWVKVGSEEPVTIPLSVGERVVALNGGELDGGEYSHVKLVVRQAFAEMNPGFEIDEERLDSAAVWIMDEGEIVEVRKEVFPFIVDESSRMEVVAEINSRQWVTAGAIQRGTISGSEFLRSVELEILRR